MDIIEKDIPYLDNNMPNVHKHKTPIPKRPHILRPYYCMIASGCAGSGKTTIVCKAIRNSEEAGYKCPITGKDCEIVSYLFSPSAENNPIFTTLKSLEDDRMITEFTLEKLEEVVDYIKAEGQAYKKYIAYCEAYARWSKMTLKQIEQSQDYEMFEILGEHGFKHPDELPEQTAKVFNLIFDDLIADKNVFSTKKNSLLNKLVLNRRHVKVNIYICTQNLKSCPKIVRENANVWCIYPCKNLKVIEDDIYPQFSNLLSPQEFLAMFQYATTQMHDCFTFDATEPSPEDRFKINLDTIIRLKN